MLGFSTQQDILCFDIDDRGRIGFVRRDRECMPLASFRGDTPRLCYGYASLPLDGSSQSAELGR